MEPWVVARRITRRIDDLWRFVDKVVLINDPLSLRTPNTNLSFFRYPIEIRKKKINEQHTKNQEWKKQRRENNSWFHKKDVD